MQKKTVVLIFTGLDSFTNYTSGRILDDLLEEFNLRIICVGFDKPPAETPNGAIEQGYLETWIGGTKNSRFDHVIMHSLAWKCRFKSRSFAARVARVFPTIPNFYRSLASKESSLGFSRHTLLSPHDANGGEPNSTPSVALERSSLRKTAATGLRYLSSAFQGFLVKLLSHLPANLLGNLRVRLIPRALSSAIQRQLREVNASIVVLPSMGHDRESLCALEVAKKLEIPSFYIADNWDNLSSKSVFPVPPDWVGAWGDQSRSHAIRIHGFEPNRVFSLGTARFSRHIELTEDLSSKQIQTQNFSACVLGSSMSEGDLAILRSLEEVAKRIQENEGITVAIKYRPNAAQGNVTMGSIEREGFNFIDLDASAFDLLTGTPLPNFLRSEEEFLRMMAACDLVISGPTTALLDAYVLSKRVLVLATGPARNPESNFSQWLAFEHLVGIEALPNLRICFDLEHVYSELLDSIAKRCDQNVVEKDSAREFFLSHPLDEFSSRLRTAIRLATDAK